MQKINICEGPENVSRFVFGCMRMPALSVKDAARMIQQAYDLGFNEEWYRLYLSSGKFLP